MNYDDELLNIAERELAKLLGYPEADPPKWTAERNLTKDERAAIDRIRYLRKKGEITKAEADQRIKQVYASSKATHYQKHPKRPEGADKQQRKIEKKLAEGKLTRESIDDYLLEEPKVYDGELDGLDDIVAAQQNNQTSPFLPAFQEKTMLVKGDPGVGDLPTYVDDEGNDTFQTGYQFKHLYKDEKNFKNPPRQDVDNRQQDRWARAPRSFRGRGVGWKDIEPDVLEQFEQNGPEPKKPKKKKSKKQEKQEHFLYVRMKLEPMIDQAYADWYASIKAIKTALQKVEGLRGKPLNAVVDQVVARPCCRIYFQFYQEIGLKHP